MQTIQFANFQLLKFLQNLIQSFFKKRKIFNNSRHQINSSVWGPRLRQLTLEKFISKSPRSFPLFVHVIFQVSAFVIPVVMLKICPQSYLILQLIDYPILVFIKSADRTYSCVLSADLINI